LAKLDRQAAEKYNWVVMLLRSFHARRELRKSAMRSYVSLESEFRPIIL
jgi:hypothetical protein